MKETKINYHRNRVIDIYFLNFCLDPLVTRKQNNCIERKIEAVKPLNSMTQKTIKLLIDEIFSKPPKKYFITNKLMFVILMIIGV